MRKFILTFMFLSLILLVVAEQEEEVVFKSALKDADFCPLLSQSEVFQPLEPDPSDPVGWDGWWTLKFENGAIIRVNRSWSDRPRNDIWWVGKEYKVTRDRFLFFVTLTRR